jgi:hypothetical protein
MGAGPVRLLQSLYLVKYHMKLLNLKDNELQISIFDRRSQKDLIYPSSEQNLALSWRGTGALENVELLEVLENAVSMKGRYIHALKGKGYVQPYGSHSGQVTFFLIV